MKKEELKNLQAPLKQKYREKPDAALITLKTANRYGEFLGLPVELLF